MQKILHISFIILSLAIICGCARETRKSYKNDKGQQVEEVYYSGTNLKSRTIYLNGTTEYLYAEYFEDEILKDSMHVIDGKTEGKRIFFDRKGDLKHTEHYQDGIFHGPQLAEYSNGIKNYEGYWLNGVKVGEWTFHYPDGRPITYEFYDSTGRIKYLEKFGTSGEVLIVEGNALINVVINQANAAAGDTLHLLVLAGLPPASLVTLLIKSQIGNNKKQTVFTDELHQLHTQIPFSFTEAGNYLLEFDLQILDIKSKKSRHYTHSLNLDLK